MIYLVSMKLSRSTDVNKGVKLNSLSCAVLTICGREVEGDAKECDLTAGSSMDMQTAGAN